jgi:hypothetical protein
MAVRLNLEGLLVHQRLGPAQDGVGVNRLLGHMSVELLDSHHTRPTMWDPSDEGIDHTFVSVELGDTLVSQIPSSNSIRPPPVVESPHAFGGCHDTHAVPELD